MTLHDIILSATYEISSQLKGMSHLLESYSPEGNLNGRERRSVFIGIGNTLELLHNQAAQLAELIDISEHVDFKMEIEEGYRLDRNKVGVGLTAVEATLRNKKSKP